MPKLGSWLPLAQDAQSTAQRQALLKALDAALQRHNIGRCALGTLDTADAQLVGQLAPALILASERFNVAVDIKPGDIAVATALAQAVVSVARSTPEGLGNFRLCGSACVRGGLPFFPGATAPTPSPPAQLSQEPPVSIGFALGLENGDLINAAVRSAGALAQVHNAVRTAMEEYTQRLEYVVRESLSQLVLSPGPVAALEPFPVEYHFLGIDTSANPGLQPEASVAAAIESLPEVKSFGGPGTLAAAAAITTALQSLSVPLVGYCGLMLPVCEDARLAELVEAGQITIPHLLSISSVCGVGVDTVPVAGDVSVDSLASLMLDVSALAHRWQKPLTCRVFPVPGLTAGDATSFTSPHLVNTKAVAL